MDHYKKHQAGGRTFYKTGILTPTYNNFYIKSNPLLHKTSKTNQFAYYDLQST